MGHKKGHDYKNELQRAFMNGELEASFRNIMLNATSIYQLETPSKNRSY